MYSDRFTIDCVVSLAVIALLSVANASFAKAASPRDAYHELVEADNPVGWWRLKSGDSAREAASSALPSGAGMLVGGVKFSSEGASSSESSFGNTARFDGATGIVRVLDFSSEGSLKIGAGEQVTLEAWVRPSSLERLAYIVGKGRTLLGDHGDRNQNYSLRLERFNDRCHISFFFCDSQATPEEVAKRKDGHRWVSGSGFALDGRWHHVAVTYCFGEKNSLKGFIDGVPINGRWDLGGATSRAPVVDDDELWIGGSMGGRGGQYSGDLAEVAVYRQELSPTRIRQHYELYGRVENLFRPLGEVESESIPENAIHVTLSDSVLASRNWEFPVNSPVVRSWDTEVMAFTELPRKYSPKGIIEDYSVPCLMTAATHLDISSKEQGQGEFLLRALSAARLYVDGELVCETPFQSLSRSGHGELHKLKPKETGIVSLPAGHAEIRVPFDLSPGRHRVVLEAIVGHPGRVLRVGELVVGILRSGESPRMLSPTGEWRFDDQDWLDFLKHESEQLERLDQTERHLQMAEESEWWKHRHQLAAEFILQSPGPEVPEVQSAAVNNEIDRFILHRLEVEGVSPAEVVEDLPFLRRVYLDVVGVVPSPAEVARYLDDPQETRRSLVIDRLLGDPRWADHWVPYWQDVLAENVAIAKPTLNNTGPFRLFIYDAFRDEKGIDRFATDLIMMEGSPFDGGAAGFRIATQNDVPMASKAHVLGTAFLAIQMKCARCHDSPLQSVDQKDLFSLGAMLQRKSLQVPLSSTVPGTPEQLSNMLIEITLKPGESISPQWPFEFGESELPQEQSDAFVKNPKDTRELLAFRVTWPASKRFARVIANRVWKRYLGLGLVKPVDDWETFAPSHPELLDYLARELVLSGYDLKHLARIILNSQTYQRQPGSQSLEQPELFAAAIQRPLSAEQLVDSLYAVAGKPLDSEELTLDRNGRQLRSEFVSLGVPTRAWEMVATSNDRDRPSTILHSAQSIVDLMMSFGWRQTRPDPLTDREQIITPLMPMMLAHGTALLRVIDMSDESALTELAIQKQSVEELVDRLMLRCLTRFPSAAEREMLCEQLSEGYETRIVAGAEAVRKPVVVRSPRAWSNNLSKEANEVSLSEQELLLKGDSPTQRLDPEWRTRMEEAVWALLNLPEFVIVP